MARRRKPRWYSSIFTPWRQPPTPDHRISVAAPAITSSPSPGAFTATRHCEIKVDEPRRAERRRMSVAASPRRASKVGRERGEERREMGIGGCVWQVRVVVG
jgi:hypothetical protein